MPNQLLIIDDNEDTTGLLTLVLGKRFPSLTLLASNDGDEAVRLAANPDVKVAVVLGSFDKPALALVRDLRAANAALPIISVSEKIAREDALSAGASDHDRGEDFRAVSAIIGKLLAGAAA